MIMTNSRSVYVGLLGVCGSDRDTFRLVTIVIDIFINHILVIIVSYNITEFLIGRRAGLSLRITIATWIHTNVKISSDSRPTVVRARLPIANAFQRDIVIR